MTQRSDLESLMRSVDLSLVLPWNTSSEPPSLMDDYKISIEGLWVTIFSRGHGDTINGTAVFREGLILGGDNERCYIGEYRKAEAGIEGWIDVPLHTRTRNPSHFFGGAIESRISFTLAREKEGRFPYVGDAEIENAVDVCPSFAIALQLAYRLF